MMIGRISKEQCTGCTACANVCPRDAISMRRDEEGFPYPAWEKEKCIHCGKCLAVCPAVRQKRRFALPPATYAAWAEEQLRKESSSGGAFSVFAGEILSRQGSVCGAAFTPDFQVEHRLVHETDGLGKLRRSKYVQSTLGFTFREIRRRLEAGEPVLFSGCPCQVAGLRSFLGKAYETLFTLDLICSGVTSPLAWEVYLKSQGKAIRDISFRSKARFGWTPNLEIQFADGTTLQEEISENLFCRLWLPERILVRPSCLRCPFAGLPRPGDITLADFWGIENYRPDWNDNGGTSLILVNTRKGKELLEACISHFQRIERMPYSAASSTQDMLKRPVFQPDQEKKLRIFRELSRGKFPGNRHYDVGILNFFWSANYGAAATGTALYHLLETLGKHPALIYPPEPWLDQKNIAVPDLLRRISAARYETEIFVPSPWKSMTMLNHFFDTFIVGSDQIWNASIRSGSARSVLLLFFFLLCFADCGKRKIAMAVSFGEIPFWNALLHRKMKRYIQRFHAVSVREKQGVEICEKLYQKQAEFVLDPVFLVDREFFLERSRNGLFQKEEGKKKGKILLRYVLDSNRFKRKVFHQLLRHLKKREGTLIVRRTLPECSSRITLDDWLSGFQSADYILTDSFHGLCFSILFRKPFLVILNRARGADRFHSLLSLLHLEDRLIDESATRATISAILERPIRYQETEEILAGMREKSIAWLKRHLEEELRQEESAPYTRESTLQEECSLYLEEREMLEDLLMRYRRSHSVQLGLFLTWLPRKLLSLLTGRRY